MKKGFIYLGAVVAISLMAVLLSAMVFVLADQSKPRLTQCTLEAKLCPDGSAVGRTGPKCEFTACPNDETTNWKTYRNEQYRFEFKYPAVVPFKVGNAGKPYPVDFDEIYRVAEFGLNTLFAVKSDAAGLLINIRNQSADFTTLENYVNNVAKFKRNEAPYESVVVTPAEIGSVIGFKISSIIKPSYSTPTSSVEEEVYIERGNLIFAISYFYIPMEIDPNDGSGYNSDKALQYHTAQTIISTFKFIEPAISGTSSEVKISTPAQGDTWLTGQNYLIKWQSPASLVGKTISITLGPPRPACLDATPRCLIAEVLPYTIADNAINQGFYQWSVPNDLPTIYRGSQQVTVTISETSVRGRSGVFTVQGATAEVPPVLQPPVERNPAAY